MYKPLNDDLAVDEITPEPILVTPLLRERHRVYVKALSQSECAMIALADAQDVTSNRQIYGIYDEHGRRLALTQSLDTAQLFAARHQFELATLS
jgi:Protein of unknown function (DUF1150)